MKYPITPIWYINYIRFTFLLVIFFFLLPKIPFLFQFTVSAKMKSGDDRPNILWISTEDHGPILGAYGDEYAHTPNLDELADEGIVYHNAFVSAPLCAPARSAIITGMHATSLGTQNLRSDIPIPPEIRTLPEVLRAHGYYTANNDKTDYNFNATGRWDESGGQAHWRNRESDDQPFFSVFNLRTSHEGSTNSHGEERFEPLEQRRDPAEAELPPYFPDTEEMRRLWARIYDLVSLVDLETKDILDQLEEDGLLENTIVFFWSDHGFGLPRYKRWNYTSGLHVPLIIRIPEKYQHLAEDLPPGSHTDQLVSFVDLAPTVLSLAGIASPEYMEGVSFMGEYEVDPRTHFIAHRDRADDVYDMTRAVRTEDFMYVRNYMPHLPYIQKSWIYSDDKRSYKELHRVREKGELPEHAEAMYQPRPTEELFDVQADPWELNNLADDPEYRYVLEQMRTRLDEWILETRDTGFLQEAEMMIRGKDSTPYEMVQDPDQYDLPRIKAAAELVGDRSVPLSVLTEMLKDEDSGVRYWAAVALRERVGHDAWKVQESLQDALSDESEVVQITAAETLCFLGHCSDPLDILAEYLQDDRQWLALQAAISLRELGDRVAPIEDVIHETRLTYSGDRGSRGYSGWGYPMFIGFAMDQIIVNLGGSWYPVLHPNPEEYSPD